MLYRALGGCLSVVPLTRIAVTASLVVALSAAMAPGAPIMGIYKSDDMDGGSFLTGRWTEGYVLNNPDGIGNGAHAGSWDANALYTQWELTGPLLVSSTKIVDTVVGGDGLWVYDRRFDVTAATLTLKSQPWWTGLGDGDYTVDLDSYSQLVVIEFSGGTPVFASSTESFYGTFQGYPQYSLVGQASGAFVGQGAALPPPAADWPAWVRSGAAGGVLNGAWGETGLIQFRITPEPATIGLLGLGLVGVFFGRRRK